MIAATPSSASARPDPLTRSTPAERLSTRTSCPAASAAATAWRPAVPVPPATAISTASLVPEVLDDLAVALDTRPEYEHGEAVRPRLERARDAGAHPHHVVSLELDELRVELDPPGALEHQVDLLGAAVTMRERLAPARLDLQVVEAGLLGADGLSREARLLGVADAVLGRLVLHIT